MPRGRKAIKVSIKEKPLAQLLFVQSSSDEVLGKEGIVLLPAEVEVLRLCDLEKMYQEQAGRSMGISRATVWRYLEDAREKTIRAIMEGRPLIIGGNE